MPCAHSLFSGIYGSRRAIAAGVPEVFHFPVLPEKCVHVAVAGNIRKSDDDAIVVHSVSFTVAPAECSQISEFAPIPQEGMDCLISCEVGAADDLTAAVHSSGESDRASKRA